jgi:hypothetical protein
VAMSMRDLVAHANARIAQRQMSCMRATVRITLVKGVSAKLKCVVWN